MEIRLAEPKDYRAYCALATEVDLLHTENAPRYYRSPGTPPRSLEYFDSVLQDPQQAIFIAENEGEAAGYVQLGTRTEPDLPILVPMNWTNISDIVVGKKFQRKGIGKALVEQAKIWARQKGSKDLRLTVASFNESAQAFYEREGFGVKHQVLALPLEP